MKQKRKFTVILAITAMILSLIFPGSVFAAGKSIPSKVTLSKVSAKSYNTVNVKWKKASNVTSYAIYYRQSGTKKWTRIATVPSKKTEYTHKSSNKYSIKTGQKYDYTVRGYNSKSKKYGTYNSNGLSVKTLPDTVRLDSAGLNSDKSVTVRWKASGGADRYVIYRKLSGGSWKRIKTVTSSAIPGSVLSYIDKNPKIGEKNIYTIRSYYSKTRTYGKYNSRGISITVPAAPAPTPTPKPENTAKIKAEVVKIVNQERAKVNLPPLKEDAKIDAAADVRARELKTLFSHTRPDGSICFSVLNEFGISCYAAAENIASGYSSPSSVMKGWMNSLGHRQNILTDYFGKIGIGYYKAPNGYKYWVQLFTS